LGGLGRGPRGGRGGRERLGEGEGGGDGVVNIAFGDGFR